MLLSAAAAAAFSSTANEKEAYVELRDRWHRTALHWAVVNMEEEAVLVLIEGGATVDGVAMPVGKHMKQTSLPLEAPLHSAARLPARKAAPMLRLLLEAQADTARRDQFGQTALHCAVAAAGQDQEEGAVAASILLQAGADACHVDDHGKAPADLAVTVELRRQISSFGGPQLLSRPPRADKRTDRPGSSVGLGNSPRRIDNRAGVQA